MTIKELIEQLQEKDQNKQILIWDDETKDSYPIESILQYVDNDVVLTY